MDFGIREIGSLALSLALGGGPVSVLIVLIALLNRRDRRQGRSSRWRRGNSPARRCGATSPSEARCPLLAGGGVVRVDASRLDGGVARQVIERLRQTLPPMVRLAIEGAPDPAHAVERPGPPAFSERDRRSRLVCPSASERGGGRARPTRCGDLTQCRIPPTHDPAERAARGVPGDPGGPGEGQAAARSRQPRGAGCRRS